MPWLTPTLRVSSLAMRGRREAGAGTTWSWTKCPGPREVSDRALERLELLERLPAATAPADRLARRRAELASDLGIFRVAVGARRRAAGAEELDQPTLLRWPRRRDAVRLELRARLGADPVRRPGGGIAGHH